MATPLESHLLTGLCATYLRSPISWGTDAQGAITATFDPPLTTDEQATYADLAAMSKSPFLSGLTLTEYQTLKPFLATEATWVQASRNAFVQDFATDINQRRLLFDALTAVIRVQRALMRQG